jgi:hypothetical protein
MGTPFKMKGSPMQRNFGLGSPLHDEDKVVKGGTKETVVVSEEKPERHSDKYKRVKSETSELKGDARLANLSKEYGGEWTTEDRSAKGGSKGTFVNSKGQTTQKVAVEQGRAKNKKKAEYIAKNTTKN